VPPLARRASVAALICALSLAQPARAAPARHAALWMAAEAARTDQLALLQRLVDIDSGTGDVEGGRKVAAILRTDLEAFGAHVEMVPAEVPGLPENLVATLDGHGRGRVLMIAHLDTVFEPGAAVQRPYRTAAARAYGPGVVDEKGGAVEALYALKLLRQLGFKDFKRITLLVESSEERGSPGTRALIARLLKDADAELNLETGEPPDDVVVWRKGSATFQIAVKGRAAHAGANPEDGRNAAVELIHQLQADDVFPKSGPGLTANLTVMRAGTRHNIIPEDGEAEINVRVRDVADFDRVEQVLRANAAKPVVPDTVVSVAKRSAYPSLPANPATDALAARAEAIYTEVGRKLGRTGIGSASESALAAEAGVAALDGLGPVGGGYHSEAEYLELGSVTPRLYLLTRLLMELGVRPPSPGR
jgi:glutamate carboxypeptidase